MGKTVRVRTVTLLLLTLWGLSFGMGAYQIYSAWAEHRGVHGTESVAPLGLPEIPLETPLSRRPQMGT